MHHPTATLVSNPNEGAEMPIRSADAIWKGDLQGGEGMMAFGSGMFEGPYSFRSRMQEGDGTNPEELIAAAHAGCFSMQLSAELAEAGHTATSVRTSARIHFDPTNGGFEISRIELSTVGDVPRLDESAFVEHATSAKENCPVSKALAVEITLEATLAGS
jgi:lipoyl-dependent peroxiredoxin